jgi:hypothetical protein
VKPRHFCIILALILNWDFFCEINMILLIFNCNCVETVLPTYIMKLIVSFMYIKTYKKTTFSNVMFHNLDIVQVKSSSKDS